MKDGVITEDGFLSNDVYDMLGNDVAEFFKYDGWLKELYDSTQPENMIELLGLYDTISGILRYHMIKEFVKNR